MQRRCAADVRFLSTPSARRATYLQFYITTAISYFYPRPPRGGRPIKTIGLPSLQAFLSTPSARRATPSSQPPSCADCYFYPRPPRGGRPAAGRFCVQVLPISIHALREEGDCPAKTLQPYLRNFYPRPPRGGRQQKQRENTLLLSHYTPLCTNCKEMLAKQTAKSHRYLRKRLVFRCEASRKTMCAADSHWPDIKRSARCLGQILGAVQRARPWSGSCCPAGRTADCPRQGRSGRSALL